MQYKVRKLLRRLDGRLEEAVNGQNLDQGLTQFFVLHQKRLNQKNQLGKLREPQVREGFRQLVKALAGRGRAKIHVLYAGKQAVASICNYEFRGAVSFFQGGFDPAYYQFSPGHVIHALRIDAAINDGGLEYDFLRGDEAYKSFWANDQRRLYSLELITGSWRRFPYQRWEKFCTRLVQSEALRALYMRLRPGAGQLDISEAEARSPIEGVQK